MRVVDVTRADVLTFRDALPIGNGSKNRVTAVLSGIMRHAELLDLRRAGSNPCKGLRRRSTGFKATYLTHAEFKALGRTLTDVREAHPEAAALTGSLRLYCRSIWAGDQGFRAVPFMNEDTNFARLRWYGNTTF